MKKSTLLEQGGAVITNEQRCRETAFSLLDTQQFLPQALTDTQLLGYSVEHSVLHP